MPDGREETGKVYKLTLSNIPVEAHDYREIFVDDRRMNIDSELLDFGPHVIRILLDNGVGYITVTESRKIRDRSWEMSAALAAQEGRSYFASGLVTDYSNGRVSYGPVQGISKKQKNHKGMKLITVM